VKLAFVALLLVTASPVCAEATPMPGADDPRLQTLVERPGEPARLVVFPEGSLTLILRRGERVERVVLSDSAAFRVAVTGDNDSLNISPLRPGATATMDVHTASGIHRFNLQTGRGLAAAYVVRLLAAPALAAQQAIPAALPDQAAMSGRYRLSGDRSLRPKRIADDGAKTYIEWNRAQSLPAVLGIGPSGEEEVVAGYMRHGVSTIDRVYSELVFRIDKQKTTARRQSEGARP
jgi:type IV secretion system protein VirB9